MKALLKHDGINVNRVDSMGNSPLHLAVLYSGSDASLVKILFQHRDVDVNALDKSGMNVLQIALRHQKFSIVHVLLDERQGQAIEINHCQNGGECALFMAVKLRRRCIDSGPRQG